MTKGLSIRAHMAQANRLRDAIIRFSQADGECLSQAWGRFEDILGGFSHRPYIDSELFRYFMKNLHDSTLEFLRNMNMCRFDGLALAAALEQILDDTISTGSLVITASDPSEQVLVNFIIANISDAGTIVGGVYASHEITPEGHLLRLSTTYTPPAEDEITIEEAAFWDENISMEIESMIANHYSETCQLSFEHLQPSLLSTTSEKHPEVFLHKALVATFKQRDGESLQPAYDRFKGLLMKAPHHGLNDSTLLDHFTGGLLAHSRDYIRRMEATTQLELLFTVALRGMLDMARSTGASHGIPAGNSTCQFANFILNRVSTAGTIEGDAYVQLGGGSLWLHVFPEDESSKGDTGIVYDDVPEPLPILEPTPRVERPTCAYDDGQEAFLGEVGAWLARRPEIVMGSWQCSRR